MLRKLAPSLAAAAIALASSVPAGAATKTVQIPDRRFQPEILTIFVGDTVRWINLDNQRHTVTANTSAQAQGESFDSSPNCDTGSIFRRDCLERGDTFSHTFTNVGTFTYHCKLHGSNTSFANCAMCGQVVVKQKAAPPASASPSARPTASMSPTASASPTATGSVTPGGSPSSPVAAGDRSSDGSFPTLPVAALALVLLGTSGFYVWRTMIRG